MNNKGQALVEFVLILPIIILILFSVIDFGVIFVTKINLENYSDDVITYIRSDKDISMINNVTHDKKINVSVDKYSDEFSKINISKKINVMTPGLDKILGSPYVVSVERIINNDEVK